MKIKDRRNYKPGPKDECGTPEYAVLPIIEAIEQYRISLNISKTNFIIWEPAAGIADKHHTGIIQGLSMLGYRVFCTRFTDFTTTNFEEQNQMCLFLYGHPIRMIVTNPPFSVRLKRLFIKKCEEMYKYSALPWALLMNTTTLVEKVNGKIIQGCALHIPYGRICFNMPNKGWGTIDKPTKPTFTTNWFSRGLVDSYSIHYNDFDMSDHFLAMNRFYNDEILL